MHILSSCSHSPGIPRLTAKTAKHHADIHEPASPHALSKEKTLRDERPQFINGSDFHKGIILALYCANRQTIPVPATATECAWSRGEYPT